MADFWKNYKPRPEGEQPPLHIAVKAQDLAGLQEILAAEAGKAPYEEHRKGNTFLSERDELGLCALHHAVRLSNLDIIKALCDTGHPINTKISNAKSGLQKETALTLATHGLYENATSDGKRLEVVSMVLAAGAKPEKDAVKNLLKSIGRPSSSECCEVVKALVEAGVPVDKDLVTAAQQKYTATTTTDAGEPAEGDARLYEIFNFLQDYLAGSKAKAAGKGKNAVQNVEAPAAEEDSEESGDDEEEGGEENGKGKGRKGKDKGKSQLQREKAELRSLLESDTPDIDRIKEIVQGEHEIWVTGQMVRQSWYKYQFSCNELESGKRDLDTGDANLKAVYEFLNDNQTPGKGKDDRKGKGNYKGDRDRGYGGGYGKGKYDRKGYDGNGNNDDYDGKGKGKKGYEGGDKGGDKGKGYKGRYGDDKGKGKDQA